VEGIEFETGNLPKKKIVERFPLMVRVVMKLGVHDPIKANYILLGLSFTMIVASVFLFVGPGSNKTDLKPIIIDKQRALMEMQSHR
jgi:hypothetical protein